MSHIFDALQRSETERSGPETPTFSLATELLQVAEENMNSEKVATPELPRELQPELSPVEQCRTLPVSVLPNSRLVSIAREDSLGAEKFRFLAVRLRQLRQTRPLKKILITSTIPQEGKSTVAANLACTLARKRQQRTLLIDGDLRRPTIASQLFGLGNVPGLCEWLQGETASTNIYHLESLGL